MNGRMSDEHSDARELIDLDEPADLERWSQAFGVSTTELISAVCAVGERASRVQSYLQALR